MIFHTKSSFRQLPFIFLFLTTASSYVDLLLHWCWILQKYTTFGGSTHTPGGISELSGLIVYFYYEDNQVFHV
uniref:Putative ovule protein n=1 Tax=Solanum chacoense TaxID=4108 RepID=A0A0V0H187_SOLCH